ncbi:MULTISPECIES: hypothetical protein [Streptomyces]|uniref:Uncharacterized protein n=1 Tax=Streptomyces noursei TaxID=1971 RepID=A0A059VRE7_STRNR|nr:hypothetical protein [Streptomyces noursei]AKA02354.1 hypothetical protein SAZ_07940 [Streptomyces noursei ZPM]AIA01999.1 hypothetical protein DC74_1483 [Streptomyces noursei]EOS97212.1 hypothetical protein K530_45140 [Streptomyces noursei CCRC 11814]EXU86054.1 hypothetical protein P354_04510 [Streptomyces noursei PD-1]MCE4945722.1 hypothetical protein [Streptomyces noursei]
MTTKGSSTPGERRPAELYTGSERPFDAEDLVRASGREPTPESLQWAQRLIDEKGRAALERYLP